MGEIAAGAELEIFDFARCEDAIMRGAGDRELRFSEEFGGEMHLAHHQGGAHRQGGLAAGEKLLTLDVELRVQPVVLGMVG